MEPAARCPMPGPLSVAGSAPLPVQANKNPSTQGPALKSTASMREEAVTSGQQLSYTEVGAAYKGVVAGLPVIGVNAGVDSSAPLPTKNWLSGG